MAGMEAALATIKAAQDPISALNQLAQSNEQLQPAAAFISQNGNAKAAFYAMAKQKGVNPEQFIAQLQAMKGMF